MKALDNFTRIRNPFTGELLSDENTVYIDAIFGDDLNPGTRLLPKKTTASINQGNKIYVLRGVFTENLNYTHLPHGAGIWIIGEPNTFVDGSFVIQPDEEGTENVSIAFLNLKSFSSNYELDRSIQLTNLLDCRIGAVLCANGFVLSTSADHCFFENLLTGVSPSFSIIKNCTVKRLRIYAFEAHTMTNMMITESVNLFSDIWANTSNYATLQNSIIRKSVSWEWISSIIPISWTEPGNEIQDIKASLYAYADNVLTADNQKDYLKRIADRIFGEGTIVYDDSEGNIRIFNSYDEQGNPGDYTLNLQNGNPALFTSDARSYVGCYRPNIQVDFDFDNVENLDGDGHVIGAGDMLKNNNGIFCDVNSDQSRNRVSSGVVAPARGSRFTQFRCSFRPSDAFYLGALQPVPGLGKINAIIVEPYDDPDTPSEFPVFCAPVNEGVQIAYFTAGNKAGEPVLFSDLAGLGLDANKNLTEVGAWAVTNACDEWDGVITLPDMAARTPKIRYFRLHLIVNRV